MEDCKMIFRKNTNRNPITVYHTILVNPINEQKRKQPSAANTRGGTTNNCTQSNINTSKKVHSIKNKHK